MKNLNSPNAAQIVCAINNFITLEFGDYLKRGLSPVRIQKFQIDTTFKETIANQIEYHFGSKILNIIGNDLDKLIGENIFEIIHARIDATVRE